MKMKKYRKLKTLEENSIPWICLPQGTQIHPLQSKVNFNAFDDHWHFSKCLFWVEDSLVNTKILWTWYKTESIVCEQKKILNPKLRLKPSPVNTKFACSLSPIFFFHLHQILCTPEKPPMWIYWNISILRIRSKFCPIHKARLLEGWHIY